MAVVYIVQKQMRYDPAKRGLVPRFNLEPARQYGDLKFLLDSQATPLSPDTTVACLQERLREFSENDYLLLVGNPCLMGWACAMAAEKAGGVLQLLQWHSAEKRYIPVRAELFGGDHSKDEADARKKPTTELCSQWIDVRDKMGRPRRLKFTFDFTRWADGESMVHNEDFELDGQFLTYNDVCERFGRDSIDSNIDALVESIAQRTRQP